jgi:hypothetical protein
MARLVLTILVTSLLAVAPSSALDAGFRPQPFRVDLSPKVPHMLQKIRETRFPDEDEYVSFGQTAGIDLPTLKGLRDEWLHDFDWDTEQAYLNTLVYLVQ